jgi:DNA-binding FrmR family transcriptional regulator
MNKEQQDALRLLKTARGQIEGSIKMLEEGRYCVDISNQILAVNGLLKKANLTILKQHMNTCVTSAIEGGEGHEKIEEVMQLLEKVIK